jgi:hypothetical protein
MERGWIFDGSQEEGSKKEDRKEEINSLDTHTLVLSAGEEIPQPLFCGPISYET